MSHRLRFFLKYLVFCLVQYECYLHLSGTAVAQWLRCCATNRKVAGSIPARVTELFIDIKSFRSHCGRGSTQPLTEMNTRIISWGKGGRCVRLTTYHHPVPLSRNMGTLNSWNPLGHSRPVKGLLYLYLYLPGNSAFSFYVRNRANRRIQIMKIIFILFSPFFHKSFFPVNVNIHS